ncbi:MAG: ABC transporter permease subunit [Polyangiaceae bacterium]
MTRRNISLGLLLLLVVAALIADFAGGTAAPILSGARTALVLVVVSGGLCVAIGVPLGAIAGASSRSADALLARAVELTGTLPVLVVAAVVVSWSGEGSLLRLAICLGLLRSIELARLLRGEVQRVATEDFVLATRALGASTLWTLQRHVLPHCRRPVLVNLALSAAYVVAVEAGLSFLGLRSEPTFPSWGQLLSPGFEGPLGIRLAAAGAALSLTGSLLSLAQWTSDSTNPRLRLEGARASG